MKKIICIFLSLIGFFNLKGQSASFEWAKQLGSNWASHSKDIELDSLGNIYTVGNFFGTIDFDPGPGTSTLTSLGNSDAYVSKMDPMGNLLWAFGIGNTNDDYAYKIKIDKNNNVYIGGEFDGTVDFDPSSGVYNLNSLNDKSFILKLNSHGNFIWAKQLHGYNFSIDGNNNVITSTVFTGVIDFDPGAGIYNLNSSAGSIAISKIDSSGNFLWAIAYASSTAPFYPELKAITTDNYGNTYSIGRFEGTVDFDPGASVLTYSCINSENLFISKFNANGAFVWAKQFTTISIFSDINSITVDKNCNVYTTGNFTDVADFDPGPDSCYLNSSTGLGAEIFVSKLDSSGNFVFAKSMGGTNLDVGQSIAVDDLENIYTTGYFRGTSDFDPGVGVYNLSAQWPADMFISKLNAQGNFAWAISIGGIGNEYGYSNAIDKAGNIYTTGWFTDSVDFDPGINTYFLHTTSMSNPNAYVHKMSQLQVGIKELDKTIDINVYPNPTSGIINICITKLTKEIENEIEIYNSIGEIIYSETIIQEKSKIDLTNYANGIYFIKIISSGETMFSKKLIKQ